MNATRFSDRPAAVTKRKTLSHALRRLSEPVRNPAASIAEIGEIATNFPNFSTSSWAFLYVFNRLTIIRPRQCGMVEGGRGGFAAPAAGAAGLRRIRRAGGGSGDGAAVGKWLIGGDFRV